MQHLWCALLGTPDKTPVLSFCFLHDALLVAGVGIQLMGPLSLRDCGWTIDSRRDTAKGSASSWGTKEPFRTPSQFSSLSAHGPKASKRAGCVSWLNHQSQRLNHKNHYSPHHLHFVLILTLECYYIIISLTNKSPRSSGDSIHHRKITFWGT